MAARKQARRPGRLRALLLAVLIVLAALGYILFGEDLAHLAGRPPYSVLVRYFAKEPEEGIVEVHFIDVGQADSILIRSAEGNVLIDAGTTVSEEKLRLHLDRCGIDTIDYFICTHPHDDHIGGADMILDSFDVKTVLMPEDEADTFAYERLIEKLAEHGTAVRHPVPGESITLGDMEFLILAPLAPTKELNDASIVAKMTVGATSFLFTGDAEAASEEAMLAAYPAEVLDCDILKVGHHGSSSSSTDAFLEAVSPIAAVISVAEDNDFAHPHLMTLERIEAAGISSVLCTDERGTIVITTDGTALTIPAA